jgi:hypothetical protein
MAGQYLFLCNWRHPDITWKVFYLQRPIIQGPPLRAALGGVCAGPGQLPPVLPLSVLLLAVTPLPLRVSMPLAGQEHGYWAFWATVTPLDATMPLPHPV